MSAQGYIKLHRQITEWEWYNDINVSRLFIHCLLRANHTDKKWQGKTILKGSFITSYENLSIETGLSVQQIRTAINKLKLTNEITYQSTSQYSIIIINNWDKFQLDNTQDNKQITNEQQTNNKQITTNNNDKNDNNEKNIYLAPKNLEEKPIKKIDPYNHPIITKYMQLYKEILNKRCFLDNNHRNKLVELYSDIENFEETLPTVLKRLKHINFEGIDFTPNSSWLLKNDNYIKVLEGTYGTKENEGEYNAYI